MANDDLRQMIEDIMAPVKAGVVDLQAKVSTLVPRSEYDVRQQDIIARLTDLRMRQDNIDTWRSQRPQFSVSTEQFKSLQDDVADIQKRPAGMREWAFLGAALIGILISTCSLLTTLIALVVPHLH